MIIGLTGILGSGKSTAAKIFKDLGAEVIDADEISRYVVRAGSSGLEMVVNHFGKDFVDERQELDRKKLGALVFSNPQKKQELEDIIHPLIRREALNRISTIQQQKPNAIIVSEIPLLFESRFSYPELDLIVLISANEETCISRVMKRDDCTKELALKKIRSQIPIKEKEKLSDIVIMNDGSVSELREKIENFYRSLN